MRLRGLILAGALLATPASADAVGWNASSRHLDVPTRTFTIINRYGIKARELWRIEGAIMIQSRQLHRYWGTPIAHFGAAGWPVILEEGSEAFAGHDVAGRRPYIAISVTPLPVLGNAWWDADWWSDALSHEVLETLADPQTTGREVCDPVQDRSYRIRGILVSDFILPNGRSFTRYTRRAVR